MCRRTAALIGSVSVFLLLYVGFYFGLSRRGYAEADALRMKEFYYLQPADTDTWSILNYGCQVVFYPANAVDCALGSRRWPAPDTFGLSAGGKK